MCYFNNFVHLRSYIKNVNKNFCRHCQESQLSLSVYRLSQIVLVSIISLTELSFAICLLMVFTGKCMTKFNLPANYHLDPESVEEIPFKALLTRIFWILQLRDR
jgi:hypothetical protein